MRRVDEGSSGHSVKLQVGHKVLEPLEVTEVVLGPDGQLGYPPFHTVAVVAQHTTAEPRSVIVVQRWDRLIKRPEADGAAITLRLPDCRPDLGYLAGG